MHLVLDNDKETIEKGKIVKEALNYGISSFTPDLFFEQLVKNYSMVKKIYGERIIQYLSGYDPNYIGRNIKIPEFQRVLKKNIGDSVDKLKKDKFLDKDGVITEKAFELASLTLYIEELDNLVPKGIMGEKIHKKTFIYGSKLDTKNYKKGDRYRDIALKKSVKTAIRRKHCKLEIEDLKTFERSSRGQIYIVYAMDASGSMKGKKLELSKKAGIALAYKAINKKDKVGLVVFGTEVKKEIKPTLDFSNILKEISNIRASGETDIKESLNKAITMFPDEDMTKHLIILTDAMPTVGEKPEKETLEAVSKARAHGITISLIGISLDKKGRQLAERIAEIGEGRLYIAKDIEELDKIVLEDYYSLI